MAKEFIYNRTREIGTIGKNTVEIGHYTVDGKEMPDKDYIDEQEEEYKKIPIDPMAIFQ